MSAPLGRDAECVALDRVLDQARDGRGSVLVLRGEAGIGKSVLLDYAAGRAVDFQLARAAGVESELELPLAGLQQLLDASRLERAAALAPPQRDALRVAFGLLEGSAPDLFLVALATLGLLSDAADERPLLCLVDDVQWLDKTSVQVLSFVARRLAAERLAIVFAVREPGGERVLDGLPQLALEGLDGHHARVLLDSVVPGGLDQEVRDRIVAEARGNPLALLEFPRGLTPAELAGGFGLPREGVAGRVEASFMRRIDALPEATQRLLFVAAAEPTGDVTLLTRALGALEIALDAIGAAETEGLIALEARVRFRHPLVRSAAYRTAPASVRRRIHAALAEATDPAVDPDRRAWHRAHATAVPDETIAVELERSASRAQARGG